MDLPTRVRLPQRWFYRVRQFWEALTKRPTETQLQRARNALSPGEYALFEAMQPGEQLHSLQVLERLESDGQNHPGLISAALLHDAGKSCQPLRVWERVLIVLAQALRPDWAEVWGRNPDDQHSWRKAFIVASHHPSWGAAMALKAGSSPLTANLIRRHQEALDRQPASLEDELLIYLQAADDEN